MVRSLGDNAARRGLLRLAAVGAGLGIAGCARPERGTAVPRQLTASATVLGVPNERFLMTDPASALALEQEFAAAAARLRTSKGLPATAVLPPLQVLSVSGGGENGAFGAGLLCGWTQHGDRPRFELVTGISTGALTAPFAYLGPEYDPQLRSVYTEIAASDILRQRSLTAAIWDDGLADNSPLFRTISRLLDERMLAGIARNYESGRLLLIASTNLDAQLPVIWNIGAIAASGHPKAPETVRRILLSSAAIPGAFPPVMFDVLANGQPYQEMHVDGGAFAQGFLYPAIAARGRRERRGRGQAVAPINAYIIRNGRLDPEWAAVERRTMGIAARAISTMIAASGYSDVLRMYAATQRDGVDFNLAYIGREFDMELPAPFDQGYMRALFQFGFERGARGYPWLKAPPI
jgi:hypothetical protein